VSPGSYAITETVAWGWVITDVVCSDGSPTAVELGTAAVDLEPGEIVTCTFANQALDSDGDGVHDYLEGAGDRDQDGIPNYQDYDPSGYLYDDHTGQILSGGRITVTGPTTVTLLHDGSEGFYQFLTAQPTGTYTIAVEPPLGYRLSPICRPQDPTPFDPSGGPNPTVLGHGESGTTGHLTPTACTPYYLTFELEPGDPSVLNNNVPLHPMPPVGGATLAPNRWGLAAVEVNLALLTVIVVVVAALIRRRGA
jgi:hypothetical protein